MKIPFLKKQVKKVLPHREKWLLVDEVLELDEKRISATVTFSKSICRGHFPNPLGLVVPGHLIAEALAQAGAIIDLNRLNGSRFNGVPMLVRSEMKFIAQVLPGRKIILKAKIIRRILGMTSFQVEAFLGEKLVAQGKIVGKMVTGNGTVKKNL